MSQCLRITFVVEDASKSLFSEIIQKEAKKLHLEGVVLSGIADRLSVVACGVSESIDLFLDLLYKEMALQECDCLEVEPFLKDKDYRGVFRVIE